MEYMALYRKWRPKVFEEVVGQEHITTTIKNSIKNERIAHAYLFCGIRGTGKTSTAKIFAKALNCEKGPSPTPCNQCSNCRAIDNGRFMDVMEIDAASNRGIDEIRDLREKVKYPPSEGRYKVYIIDEVHMLTKEAFNALLKTLEEPPGYVVFILATTEPHKLPETILSRCQRYDFKRLTVLDIINKMEEILESSGMEADKDALNIIARNSQGAMRDALSLLDQCISYADRKVTKDVVIEILGTVNQQFLIDFAENIRTGRLSNCLAKVDELTYNGKDLNQFVTDLLYHFRNLMVAKVSENPEGVIDLSHESIQALKEQADGFDMEDILRSIEILSETERNVRWSSNPRIPLELALVKLTRLETDETLQGIISRVKKLEELLVRGEVNTKPSKKTYTKQTQTNTTKPDIQETRIENGVTDHEEVTNEGFEQIKDAWSDIVGILRKEKPSLRAFIDSSQPVPVKLEGRRLIVKTMGSELNKEMLERNQDLIQNIIYDTCNIEVKIVFQRISEPENKKKVKLKDDLVEQVTSVFDKDIVEIQK